MRALFRPFALHAAYTPIETIVFFCIIGTLAYFHILSAIKHSAFLDSNSASHAASGGLTWRPAHALFRHGEWVPVREGVWAHAAKNYVLEKMEGRTGAGRDDQMSLEVQQVVLAVDGGKAAPEHHHLSLSQPPLSSSTLNLTNYLTSPAFQTPSGLSYSTICHRPTALTSNYSDAEREASDENTPEEYTEEGDCFTFQQASSRSFVQTLAFKPGMRDEWTSALLGEASHHHHHHHNAHGRINAHAHALGLGSVGPSNSPRVFQDENGVRFEVIADGGRGAHGEIIGGGVGQMRNGNFWIAYAARALVMRFWDLAKKADSLDILLILAGYILMHTTFYLLLIRSRALGSSFWLPLAILSAAVLSLLLALPIAMALKIPIDPVALTEALPFLVCTVGFDKPLRLARAVFLHPHLSVPPPPGDAGGYPTASASNGAIASGIASATSVATLSPPPSAVSASGPLSQLKPAPKIITESLTLVYAPIIRDYILEIAVLTVGAYSKVGGLAEVCALAALILAVDCLLLCTYLAAILGIMVEVRRIKTLRTLTRSRSNSITSNTSSVATRRPSAMARPVPQPSPAQTPKTLRQRVKSALLGGEKGSGLPEYERCYGGRGQKLHVKGKGGHKQENPVARLKLLLIATFMTLHTLNLITPLTPSRHNYSSASTLDGQVNIRKVDITQPLLRTVLAALETQSDDILVKVHPPIYVRALLPSAKSSSSFSSSFVNPYSSNSAYAAAPSGILQRKSTSERLDAFMSAWTRLVGDPILSKWIVVLLAISVVLNGYLLKGIAAGVVGAGVGGIRAFGVRGAVRFEEEEEHVATVEEPEVVVEERKPQAIEPKPVETAEAAESTPHGRNVVVAAAVAAPANSVGPAPLSAQPTVGTFTLEDVDRRLEQARANSRRMTVTPASVAASFSSTTPTSSSSSTFDGSLSSSSSATSAAAEARPLSEVLDIFEHGPRPLAASLALLTDEEVIMLCQEGRIQPYGLEKALGMELESLERAVRIRRAVISRSSRTKTLENSDIPLTQYDYSRVYGACCENVVGYIPLPLGIAGPLTIDGQPYLIPMATAEGTLVASTSRGCKALNAGGGVTTVLLRDAMTRGPAVEFQSITEAARCVRWIESAEGSETLRRAFESTSRFAKLVGGSASGVDSTGAANGGGLKTALAGRTLYIRFRTTTGDAMGMNMISKGTEKALAALLAEFPTARILALSGNYCTDKKAAAINWIEGRGKSIVAECVIPGNVVEKVLKTTVKGIVELNTKKNLIGSALAGVVGGFNAHAANIVAAVFLATGQDPAQVVESSMCLTGMEAIHDGRDLLITVTMPSIEVGTVGGGTVLSPQGAVLSLLGIKGAHPTHPGHNAQTLARIVASAVMAGELSLMSALAAGDLIRAHMTHNRSTVGTPAVGPGPVLGGGHGVLVDAPASEEKKLVLAPLTPSASSSALPAL